jgi:hypothetical protein
VRSLTLHTDLPPPHLDLEEVGRYLEKVLRGVLEVGVRNGVEEDFGLDRRELARGLAGVRIRDLGTRSAFPHPPTEEEVEEELAILERGETLVLREDLSNLYEGFSLAAYFRERAGEGFPIVVTSRMPVTWEGGERRYHGRTLLCHYPLALISTTGLVEAPARPREYYLRRIALERARGMGMPVEETGEEFLGASLTYGDPRLTEVVKGYALQGAFYFLTYDPFCDDPDCRLFNAHTQGEMIRAQIRSGRLCGRHWEVLEGLRAGVKGAVRGPSMITLNSQEGERG